MKGNPSFYLLGSLASSHLLQDVNQVPDKLGKTESKADHYEFVLPALGTLGSLGIKGKVVARHCRSQMCGFINDTSHKARNQVLGRTNKHPNHSLSSVSMNGVRLGIFFSLN